MPVGNLPGWRHIFRDDTQERACRQLGQRPTPARSSTPAQGQQWHLPAMLGGHPTTQPIPAGPGTPASGTESNFHLHSVDAACGRQTRRPSSRTAWQYQTYGRYSVRMKVDNCNLSDYGVAWLLWASPTTGRGTARSTSRELAGRGPRTAITITPVRAQQHPPVGRQHRCPLHRLAHVHDRMVTEPIRCCSTTPS